MNRLLLTLLHAGKRQRVFDSKTHAALDYLTTGFFLCTAAYFWGRHRRATATALINGIAVLGTSLFTNYPGALKRIIPFETHGKVDVLQALTAAGLPILLGFDGDIAAVPFRLQSLNEFAVVSTTDWQSATRQSHEKYWRVAS